MEITKYRSEIVVNCKDEKEARTIIASISHEGKGSERAYAQVKQNGKEIIIRIFSQDATALRAFLNSFLRDLQVIEGASFGDAVNNKS